MTAVFGRTDGGIIDDSDACVPAEILPFFLLRDASSSLVSVLCWNLRRDQAVGQLVTRADVYVARETPHSNNESTPQLTQQESVDIIKAKIKVLLWWGRPKPNTPNSA